MVGPSLPPQNTRMLAFSAAGGGFGGALLAIIVAKLLAGPCCCVAPGSAAAVQNVDLNDGRAVASLQQGSD